MEPTVTIEELKRMMEKREDFFLIDVREREEYEAGHIPGAMLIPFDTLEEKIKGIRKDKLLVLHCETGRRSQNACELLRRLGYTNVCNLAGGYEMWQDAAQSSFSKEES